MNRKHTLRKLLPPILLLLLLTGLPALAADSAAAPASSAVCTGCWGDPAAMASCSDCGGSGILTSSSRFAFSIWALVPPVVAIALALITKETYSSLFIGIVAGALLANNFAPAAALDSIIRQGFTAAITDNAGNFIFLVLLGAMVALVNATGAASAFGKWTAKNVRTKTGALLATFLLGILIFIDDYFNCLTVGTVMRPLTDRQRISRAKLAYIIDATAAPVCMIAPVSSWAAAVSDVVGDSLGEGMSSISLFIRAIPFNFYSLLTLVFVIGLSLMGFDYGPMAKKELAALKGDPGSLGGDRAEEVSGASLWDMLVPVTLLIISCVAGLLYAGGFLDPESSGFHSFSAAFEQTDAFLGLPLGSLTALILSVIYLLCRKTVSFQDAVKCLTRGFEAMVPALLILSCAVALKNMTGLLGAASYVATLVRGAAAGLMSMLPAIIFLIACLLAFSTGTSWGTFGILIPIVLPLFSPEDPLLMIGISACLAGAVCGDHCSPISDTTIMASAGANVNHLDHVTTQMPYAITVAVISFFSFILAGFVKNIFICLPLATLLTVGALFILRAKWGVSTSADT